jgi:hypothetical protein
MSNDYGNTWRIVSGTTGGVFSDVVGNSDYYSYLRGIETYANPEAVDINVFATPGIDWYNHNVIIFTPLA